MGMNVLHCARDLLRSGLSITIIFQLQFFPHYARNVIRRMKLNLPREHTSLISMVSRLQVLRQIVSVKREQVPMNKC